MKFQLNRYSKLIIGLAFVIAIALIANASLTGDHAFAQAGRNKPSDKQKKNPNASGDPEEAQKEQDKQDRQKVDKSIPPAQIKIDTNIVNVEAVVFNKKTGGIIQGLKKENFEIYEDGVKQEIENFST